MGRAFIITLGALAVLAAALATPAVAADAMDPQAQMIRQEIEAYMQEQKSDFRVYWKEGLTFQTRDENFKMKIGGRIQLDTWFYADSDDRDAFNEVSRDRFRSGVEFRRVRLYTEGDIYKYVKFKLQLDFAPVSQNDDGLFTDSFEFKDVWIGFHNLDKCLGCWFPDIVVGHFKEYFSLEELTSSKYIDFMERSLPVEAFAPSRNLGIGLKQTLWGERFLYSVGYFFDTPGLGNQLEYYADEGQHVTGRVVFMPWAPCDCETQFWSIGGSVSYQFDDPNGFRYRARPGAHIADRVVDIRIRDAETALLWGVETAFVYDRFKVQAEYISAMPDVNEGDDPTFSGYYVTAAYLLGGKGFAYKRSYQTFDKIKPCNNFDCTECGHMGAWELAARWSSIDLEDAGYNGGEADTITVGLNWYLNPNTRIMFNYVWADVDDLRGNTEVDGTINMFGVRFQVFW